MPTTEQIFDEFKPVLAELRGTELGNKLGKVVFNTIQKHRADDRLINQLQQNMKHQTQHFITELENLEIKKCPHLTKVGNHH